MAQEEASKIYSGESKPNCREPLHRRKNSARQADPYHLAWETFHEPKVVAVISPAPAACAER